MRQATTAIALAPLLPDWVPTADINSVYKWLGDDAVPPYGNYAPAEYTEFEKQRRYFSALLATYQTANENIMHREQRIELIKARPESPHCMSEEFNAPQISFGIPRRIANLNGPIFDLRIWRTPNHDI